MVGTALNGPEEQKISQKQEVFLMHSEKTLDEPYLT